MLAVILDALVFSADRPLIGPNDRGGINVEFFARFDLDVGFIAVIRIEVLEHEQVRDVCRPLKRRILRRVLQAVPVVGGSLNGLETLQHPG